MELEYRPLETLDWITILILFSLLVLASGKYYHPSRFMNFISLPLNDKYVSLYERGALFFNGFHLSITLFQIVNYALFIYLAKEVLLGSSGAISQYGFYPVLGGLVLFLALKTIMQLGQGYIFQLESLVADLIFYKSSYFNYSSLLIFLVNVCLVYVWPNSTLLIYLALGLVVLINSVGLLSVLKHHQNLIRANLIYFILYLCTLEIAPIVLFGSYLKV
jgi:hypothetical protein